MLCSEALLFQMMLGFELEICVDFLIVICNIIDICHLNCKFVFNF